MPGRPSSTLELLVCHTATPSPLSAQKEESLRKPEEKGTAEALEFELLSSNMKSLSFYLMMIMILYCFHPASVDLICFYFSFSPRERTGRPPNNFVLFLLNFERLNEL